MASRVGRGIALPFLDRGITRGWVVKSTHQPHFTPGKDQAGWAPGPVWTAENLASPEFDPRSVQPVVSRYTDWATRATNIWSINTNNPQATNETSASLWNENSCSWLIDVRMKMSQPIPPPQFVSAKDLIQRWEQMIIPRIRKRAVTWDVPKLRHFIPSKLIF
jgi:hypothetical protein